MKKIFTLVLGSLFAFAVSAADHQPTVTVNSSKKFEIVIDGKSYQTIGNLNLSFLRNGNHSIQVYQVNRGFFMQRRKMPVASSGFLLRNNDISINVDMFGQIRINESRSRFDQDSRDRNDKGWNNSQGHDNKNGYDNEHGVSNSNHDKRF
jgi:hypothetical protein